MPNRAYRRIQKTGGSTYIVSLPKAWVEARLKKGDVVEITEHGNDLVVSSKRHGSQKQVAQIGYDGDLQALVRRIIARYLEGADKFLVSAPQSSHDAIKRQVKGKLPGLEAIEETGRSLLFHNLMPQTEISFHTTLRRLHFLNQSMLEKLRSRIGGGTESLEDTEEEVDRFFFLAFRQLGHMTQADPDVHEHSVYYVIVLKSLEKIADHAYLLSRQLPEKMGEGERKRLGQQVEAAAAAYNAAMQALLKKDAPLAELMLKDAQQKRQIFDPSDFLSYNAQRIIDYSSDIAEMALDLYCNKGEG